MIKDARKGVSNCTKSCFRGGLPNGWTNDWSSITIKIDHRSYVSHHETNQQPHAGLPSDTYDTWYWWYCNTIISPSCYFVHYHLLSLFEFYSANHAGTHPLFVKCLSPQNWLKGNNTAENTTFFGMIIKPPTGLSNHRIVELLFTQQYIIPNDY